MKEKKLIILLAIVLLGGLLFLAMRNQTNDNNLILDNETADVMIDSVESEEQPNFYLEGETVLDPAEQLDEDNEKEIGGEVEGVSLEDSQPSSETDSSQSQEPKFVFFYGDTCPYCHDVIDWMDEAGVESMLDITRKEVYNDAKNSEQMNLAVRSCGMTQSGVPMMYTNDKECIVGSTPIIDHLSEVAGI